MKHCRLGLVAGLAIVLIVAAVWWTPRRTGHATPRACLDAYYEAWVAGDTTRYLACLGEPLATDTRRHWTSDAALGETLRTGAADLKNRVQHGDASGAGADCTVAVEEVRTSGVRRVQFRLRRVGGSWSIIGIDAGPEKPAAVPYGTHISKVEADAASH
jgi:hypothetical protein